MAAMCVIAVAFSAGSFIKVNAASSSTSAPGQPVDLTYAAEKSLPSVVHILNTRNSKVQTVEVESDPFSDFFSDPFGFLVTRMVVAEPKSVRYVPLRVRVVAPVLLFLLTDIS